MVKQRESLVGFDMKKATVAAIVFLLSLGGLGTLLEAWSPRIGEHDRLLLCFPNDSASSIHIVSYENYDDQSYGICGSVAVAVTEEKLYFPPFSNVGYYYFCVGNLYNIRVEFSPSLVDLKLGLPPGATLPRERDALVYAIAAGSIGIPLNIAKVPEDVTRYKYRQYNRKALVTLLSLALFAGVSGFLFFRTAYCSIRSRMRLSRNVCLQCGYPRVGIVEDVPCPECGFRSRCRRLQN